MKGNAFLKRIVAFAVVGILLVATVPQIAEGAGWLGSGWAYRQKITLTCTNTTTNYVTNITALYANGTSVNSTIYLNNNCQGDFADVRFTSSDGQTTLYYHLINESVSENVSCEFNIKVPSLTNGTVIYIYYGNSVVSTTSDPLNTYRTWMPIEAQPWFRYNNTAGSADYGYLNGTHARTNTDDEYFATFSGNYSSGMDYYRIGTLTFRCKMLTDNSGVTAVGWTTGDGNWNPTSPDGGNCKATVSGRNDAGGNVVLYASRQGAEGADDSDSEPSIGTGYHTFKIVREALTTKYYRDGVLKATHTHDADSTSNRNTIVFGTVAGTKEMPMDWIEYKDRNGTVVWNETFDESTWIHWDEIGEKCNNTFSNTNGSYLLTSWTRLAGVVAGDWGALINCGFDYVQNSTLIVWANMSKGTMHARENHECFGVIHSFSLSSDAGYNHYSFGRRAAAASQYSNVTGNNVSSNVAGPLNWGSLSSIPQRFELAWTNYSGIQNVSRYAMNQTGTRETYEWNYTMPVEENGTATVMTPKIHSCSGLTGVEVFWMATANTIFGHVTTTPGAQVARALSNSELIYNALNSWLGVAIAIIMVVIILGAIIGLKRYA